MSFPSTQVEDRRTAWFRLTRPSSGGAIAGICTNPSLFRFSLCDICQNWIWSFCCDHRGFRSINHWSRTWKMGSQTARHTCAATLAFHTDALSPTWFKVVSGVVLHYPVHAFLVFTLDDTVLWFWGHLGDGGAAFFRHFFLSLQNWMIFVKLWNKLERREFLQFWYWKK